MRSCGDDCECPMCECGHKSCFHFVGAGPCLNTEYQYPSVVYFPQYDDPPRCECEEARFPVTD